MGPLIQLVGWVAGVLTLSAGIPQAVKLLKTRDTEGVSSWTYVLWSQVALWWAVWGFMVHAWPTAIINTLCVPVLGLSLLVLKVAHREVAALLLSVVGCTVAAALSPSVALVVASVLLVTFSAPSADDAWRPSADLSGVAMGTWVLVVVSNFLWVLFDVGIAQLWAAVPSVVTTLLAASVVLALWRFKASSQEANTPPR